MRHIRAYFSLMLFIIIAAVIYLPGCKKDEIQGPTTPSGNAAGDLGGSYPAPLVTKLQGRNLVATAPTDGQVLRWNNTSTQWEPSTLAGLGIWTGSGNNIYSSHTGNLGLGTTAPNDEIHIKKDVNSFVGLTIENTDAGSSSTERISFTDENGSLCFIQANDDNSIAGPAFTIANNRPNGYMAWNTGGTARMTLSNAGNLGIGSTVPSQRLHVVGNICATGTIGACSDIRYKTNIASLTNALTSIMSLHGIYYNWDKEKIGRDAYTKARQIGFSAQEIEQYFPEIVQTDAKGYKAIDYSRLTPILVEAIKEQQQTIVQQKEEMKQIRDEIAALKLMIEANK
jgi:hypothetical protein